MTKFRFTGRLEFLGYTVPVDLWFDCSRTDLIDALSGLLCHVDDPTWPVTDEKPALDSGPPAALPRRSITSPHLFDELYPDGDQRNWLILAERFPQLFPEEKAGSVPGLPAPPKNRADIDKLRRQGSLVGDGPEDGSDFEQDLAALLDIPREELLKSDGTINASVIVTGKR